MNATLNPENVKKVKSFVRFLLSNLQSLPVHDAVGLLEQATALEELAGEFRDRAAAAEINFHAKNDVC